MGESRRAFVIVWIVISAAILATLVLPFVVPAETIPGLLPQCEWKARYQMECPFCGSTTAFILIAGGQFRQAFETNRLAFCLYFAFVLNEIAIAAFLIRNGRRWRASRTDLDCVVPDGVGNASEVVQS